MASRSEKYALAASKAPSNDPTNSLGTERVQNAMGSQAGAGSCDFHLYRAARRTEMMRVEKIQAQAQKDSLDDDFQKRMAQRTKECDDRTKKNAEKRKRKREAKKIKKNNAFPDDGSFLEKAKLLSSHDPPVEKRPASPKTEEAPKAEEVAS